jgi:hypothetical protein
LILLSEIDLHPLKSTAESGDKGGVSACKTEERSTAGVYGEWELDEN